MRSLRPPKSGSGIKEKKRYYLADYLSFLLPYLKTSTTSDILSIPTEQGDNSEHDISLSIPSSELKRENEFHNSSHTTSFDTPMVCPGNELHPDEQEKLPLYQRKLTKKRAYPNNTVDTAFVGLLNSKMSNPHSKERNADLLFFESLVPDVKQLDNKRKRRFKSDVLHLLNNALEECEDKY